MNAPKIYLAGPSVFFPDWKERAAAMKTACEKRGAIGLYPMDAEVPEQGGAHPEFALGLAIFAANTNLIDEADAVVADLSPFRGPSADVGTVWEIAYAQGKGKHVSGFSNEKDLYHERVIEHSNRVTDWAFEARIGEHADVKEDNDGLTIEPFKMADNLMIVGSICRSNKAQMKNLVQNGGLARSFEEALDMTLEALRQRANEQSR